MAVDEKYIEEVTDGKMDYESVLDEFGITASNEESGNGLNMNGYVETFLKDMYDEDLFTGVPALSDIYTFEFKDRNTGETVIRHKIDLVLFDDTYEDEKEAYVFPVNLNTDNIDLENNIVTNVYSASGLYAVAMGLMELQVKGINRAYNRLDVVNIDLLKQKLDGYKTLTVKVVEKEFNGNPYNSFRITEGEPK